MVNLLLLTSLDPQWDKAKVSHISLAENIACTLVIGSSNKTQIRQCFNFAFNWYTYFLAISNLFTS